MILERSYSYFCPLTNTSDAITHLQIKLRGPISLSQVTFPSLMTPSNRLSQYWRYINEPVIKVPCGFKNLGQHLFIELLVARQNRVNTKFNIGPEAVMHTCNFTWSAKNVFRDILSNGQNHRANQLNIHLRILKSAQIMIPISLVMIERISTLSYYHHQIGSMNCYPLFRVRS